MSPLTYFGSRSGSKHPIIKQLFKIASPSSSTYLNSFLINNPKTILNELPRTTRIKSLFFVADSSDYLGLDQNQFVSYTQYDEKTFKEALTFTVPSLKENKHWRHDVFRPDFPLGIISPTLASSIMDLESPPKSKSILHLPVPSSNGSASMKKFVFRDIISEIEAPVWEVQSDALRRVIVLAGLRDPGNVGTILRTASGLGTDLAILVEGSVHPFNPKVVRSSRGALLRLPMEIGWSWEETVEFLNEQGFSLVFADCHTDGSDAFIGSRYGLDFFTVDGKKSGTADVPKLSPFDLPAKVALVMGSEGSGLDNIGQLPKGSYKVQIPMSRDTESLNVASAAAILLHALK